MIGYDNASFTLHNSKVKDATSHIKKNVKAVIAKMSYHINLSDGSNNVEEDEVIYMYPKKISSG